MPIRPDTNDLIAFLDSLAQIDPVAMGKLVTYRANCNAGMADHPTVQVGKNERGPAVTMLGILNGYAGTFDDGKWKDWGPIAAVVEPDGSVSGFERTDG